MAKLGELYTELTVKDGGFAQGMARAQGVAEGLASKLEGISSKAKWVFAGLAAGIGLTVRAAGESEGANLRLNTALTLAGNGAELQSKELIDLATQLQNITIYDDEVTKGVMAYALQLGVTAPKVGEMTKQAMGLASALGMDLQTAMRGLILANNGEFTALSRYIPALRTATTDTEKLAKVNELAARGFEMAKTETLTLSGAMAQIKNQLGEAAETMGAAFLPTIKDFSALIKEIVPKVAAWIETHKDGIVTFSKWALIITGLVAAGGPLLRMVSVILSIVTAMRQLAIGQAVIAGLSGPAGWALLAGAAAATGLAIWGINKAFDGMAESAAAAGEAARNAVGGAKESAEEMAARLREHFRFMGPNPNDYEDLTSKRDVFNPDGTVGRFTPTPGGIKRTSGEDRSGGFVGVADLANRLQMAAFDTKAAEDKARNEAILKENQKQTEFLDKINDNLENQKLGLAIT